ncbi:MAG: V-type ATP synthase subunit I [Lachnospiraceae bacterium]|jgi:V/A-type H+-transporting ATPase subunit I|nr:V-type ATP synthase subunit I [Lachnospiraceae bacterium]
MIYPMKKISIYAMKQDKDALLLALQRCGEFMAVPAPEGGAAPESESTGALARDTEDLVGSLASFAPKKGFLAPDATVGFLQLTAEDAQAAALEETAKELSRQMQAAQTQIAQAAAWQEQLLPWKSLDIPIEKLTQTKTTVFRTGVLDVAQVDGAAQATREAGAYMQVIGHSTEGELVLLAAIKEEEDAALEALRPFGYADTTPPRTTGTPAQAMERFAAEEAAARASLDGAKAQLAEVAARIETLQILCEGRRARAQREALVPAETTATICLTGWVRAGAVEKVRGALRVVTDAFDLCEVEPDAGERAPTALKNNRFVSPFEGITNMFSVPAQGTLDPNPAMSLWYWLIMGMFMGDVGYGLVMAIGTFAYLKLKNPQGELGRLVRIFFMGSFTTIFFGVMYGSYFSVTLVRPVMFDLMSQPMEVLIFSLLVGVAHLFTGMVMAAIQKARGGDLPGAIFDHVSWMLLIAGLGMLFLPLTAGAGRIIAILGALIILCTAGRDAPNVFGRITGGFLGLYGISGYVSDILSYSRILALALSTAVIGFVMNLLAGMVAKAGVFGVIGAILICLVGHVFNLAMGLLSAYVHDCRLQYIEFFGKFYEGGGVEFKPLSFQTKLIRYEDKG